MRAEQVIYALLSEAAGVTALVGTRIYPGVLPQGTALPALALEFISGVELPTVDATAGFNLLQARVQVTAIAKTYAEVKTVLEAVRAACNFQRGTIAGVHVVSVRRDTIGPDLRDDDVQLFTQSIDFGITYQEP